MKQFALILLIVAALVGCSEDTKGGGGAGGISGAGGVGGATGGTGSSAGSAGMSSGGSAGTGGSTGGGAGGTSGSVQPEGVVLLCSGTGCPNGECAGGTCPDVYPGVLTPDFVLCPRAGTSYCLATTAAQYAVNCDAAGGSLSEACAGCVIKVGVAECR